MDWLSRDSSRHGTDEDIRLEVEQLARTLDRMGVTERRRLAQIVGAHYWYKGEFDRAVGIALAEGKIQEVEGDTTGSGTFYASLGNAPSDSDET